MTRPLPRGHYAGGEPAGVPGRHAGGYREPEPGYEQGYAPEYAPEYGYEGEYDEGPYPAYPPMHWYQKPKVLIALLVVVLVAGSGFYAAYALTKDAIGTDNTSARRATVPSDPQAAPLPPEATADPSPEPSADPSLSPSPEPSPSPQAQNLPPFQDGDLRAFAGRVGRNDQNCRGETSTIENINEIVTCTLNNGATVRYLRFATDQARNDYKATVRNGLSGRLNVRRDAVWQAQGQQQGTFVSGEQNGGAYVFWDSFNQPVSGELVLPNQNADNAERFWRRNL